MTPSWRRILATAAFFLPELVVHHNFNSCLLSHFRFPSRTKKGRRRGLVSSPSSSDILCQCSRWLWNKLKPQLSVGLGVFGELNPPSSQLLTDNAPNRDRWSSRPLQKHSGALKVTPKPPGFARGLTCCFPTGRRQVLEDARVLHPRQHHQIPADPRRNH